MCAFVTSNYFFVPLDEICQRYIANSKNVGLNMKVQQHFNHYARSPDYQLWLFLDNHDTNRLLFECRGDVELLKEAVAFTRQQSRPYLLYYGTEKGMTQQTDRFSGIPYADEQVRKCMKWK